MNPNEEALLQRLRVTFQSEAEEHLRIISNGLLEAEQEASPERQAELVEASFRSAHSLKGAARAVSLPEIEMICHALESIWASVKQGRLELSKPLLETLRPAVEQLSDLLVNLETTRSSADKTRIARIVRRLEQAAMGKFSEAAGSTFPDPPPSPLPQTPPQQTMMPPQPGAEVALRTEMLRVDAAKLDGLLFQTEELLAVKLTAGEQVAELEALQSAIGEWRKRNVQTFAELRHFRESQRKSNEQSQNGAEPAELNHFY